MRITAETRGICRGMCHRTFRGMSRGPMESPEGCRGIQNRDLIDTGDTKLVETMKRGQSFRSSDPIDTWDTKVFENIVGKSDFPKLDGKRFPKIETPVDTGDTKGITRKGHDQNVFLTQIETPGNTEETNYCSLT